MFNLNENQFREHPDALPSSMDEYNDWLAAKYNYDLSKAQIEYKTFSSTLLTTFNQSPFWQKISSKLNEFHDEYNIKTKYDLFTKLDKPDLLVKTFDSFINKTYRQRFVKKNIHENDDAFKPENWYSAIDDIVRTLFVVKYLDGVDHFIEILKSVCVELGLIYRVEMKCNDNGYYAAHFYASTPVSYIALGGNLKVISQDVEIQVTTQLQEVLRQFSHTIYEEMRMNSQRPEVPWQWRYKDDEFFANYLGHMLHNIEGLIMEVRRRQENNNAKI